MPVRRRSRRRRTRARVSARGTTALEGRYGGLPQRYGGRGPTLVGRRPGDMIPIQIGIKNRQFVKLNYTEVLALSAHSAASPAIVAYLSNSIYDPQNSASGWSSVSGHTNNGQPLYRDQWAAFYYKYRVYGCKISLTWQPTTNSSGTPTQTQCGRIVVYPSDAVCTDSDIMATADRNYAKARTYGGVAPSQNIIQMSAYSRPNQVLGYSKKQYTYDLTTGGGLSSGSNPSELTYFNIVIQSMNTAEDMSGYLQVKLTYYVQLFDRIENIAIS